MQVCGIQVRCAFGVVRSDADRCVSAAVRTMVQPVLGCSSCCVKVGHAIAGSVSSIGCGACSAGCKVAKGQQVPRMKVSGREA